MSYSIDQLKSALVQADAAGDTQSAQILADQIAAQQADTYVKEPPKENDMWTGFKKGAVELAENYLTAASGWASLINNPGAAVEHPVLARAGNISGIHPYSEQMKTPETMMGTVAEIAPSIAAAIPGWEMGAETLVSKSAPKVLQWAARGLGGTFGSDITSGEEITPENLASGTGANIVMETIFHTPAALKLAKVMLARNGAAIDEAAAHVGVNPSMGVTTSRQWLRTLENVINKVPGGHLLNVQNARSLKTMDSFVEGIKNKLGYKGDASALGREIEQGIKSAEADFDKESEAIYDAIMTKAGKYQRTNTRRFTRKVEELAGVNPRPGIDKMTTPPIARKYAALLDEAGKVPQNSGYSNVVMGLADARKALKLLDDYIGTGESATADEAAAKQMASALRDDITGTFDALGLGAEWRAAQDRYAEGVAMLAQARAVMGRAETGDAIYTRLFGNESGIFSAKGADTLRPLKQAMTQEEWDHVAAEVVHRLGLEGAGNAGAEGQKFNPNVFLTNWTKLKDPAKELLFSASHRYDLEQLAKLSEGFKNLGRDANHSNTAHHMAAMGMAGMAVNPIMWPKLAATLGGSALMAKLLINPKATRLLVDAAYATEPNQVQRWVIRTMAIAAAHPELSDALASLGDD